MAGNSSMLGSVELLVTPQEMYAMADLLENNVSLSRNAFDKLQQTIQSTSGYWQGDAAEKERLRFENESDNFSALVSNLINYAAELKTITGLYETTEQISVTDANVLPAGILN